MMRCQYPKCLAEAKFTLGLADPDAEKNYYCEVHCDIRKREIQMEWFMLNNNCAAITKAGKR